jgi:hypothetical protein
MPWTVSRTTSSGAGIILVTPDNADPGANWDMQSALDAAISQGLAGISKNGLNSYLADSNTGIRVEGFSGQTGFLFFSGITLECRNRFFLGDNSRIKFQIKNSNNIRQARPLLIINFFPVGYFDGEGAFSIGQNVVLHTNGFDFSYRGTGGSNTYSDGAIIDAGWRNNGSAIIKNSTFASDASNGSNAIYFLNNNAQFEDVKLVGLVLEIAKPGIFKGFTATECSKTKTYGINGGSGFYVFEDWTWIDCDEDFVFQRQSQTIFIDCAIDLNNLSDDIGGGGFGLFKNSIELQGGSSFANGNFYLQDPTAFDSYSRSFNSSGRIEGGNAEGTSIAVNSDRICATVHRISKGQSTASDFDRSGIWAGIAVKYGREPVPISLTLNGLKSGKQLVPFASASDSQITQSNAATVATYTGFAVNYSNQLVTRSSGTEAQLYDWLALEKASLDSSGVVVNGLTLPKCALPTFATSIYDRASGTFAYNLRIVGSDFSTGTRTIAMASGRTLTFATAANHSAVKIAIPSTGIVHFEQGGTATLSGTFAAGATINNGSAAALTVLVDEAQKANITTTSTGGGSITVISQTTLNFTGIIAGSTIGILNNLGVLIDSAIVPGTTYSLTLTYPGALLYSVRVRKYGSNVFANSFTLAPGTLSININQAVDPFVVLSEAAAGALSGIAINYGASLTTVSTNRTLSQLYDYARWSISQLSNIDKTNPAIATTDGVIRSLNYDLSLTGTSTITGTGTLAVGSRTLFLGAAQTYSFDATVGATGKVSVVNGTTTLSIASYASGAKFDNSTATAAIVQVPYAELANATALTPTAGEGSVTARSIPVTFTGFPTAANANGRSADAAFGVQDVSSDVWHTYDASSGSVVISLSELATAPDYQLIVRGDAIGWIRTPDSTIDADYSGTFNFANLFREIVDEDGDAMVGLGTQSVMDRITYNQSAGRFELDAGAIDFFSALDKKEVLTSSQSGLTVFDSALVRQLNFIKNAYANLIQFPFPLTAAASTTAATSPILTDFVVMRTGDPAADVFVHGLPSTALGLSDRPEIRMGTTKFISASGGSGGSGATAVQIRQEMDANSKLATVATQTARVDALIENSGGDRFKAKTLETVIEQANKPVIK